MFVSKKLGVSSTAIGVINGRWTMDVFGIRKDTASKRLNRVLPNTSLPGLWLFLFPSYLRYKISGKNKGYPSIANPGEEGISKLVLNRTVYFDNIINKSKDKVEQFVIIGAGFDTRCYGNHKDSNLKYFELDQAKTQKFKIEQIPTVILFKYGMPISGFVGVKPEPAIKEWLGKSQEIINKVMEKVNEIIKNYQEYAKKN